MSTTRAMITGTSQAFPATLSQEELWSKFFAEHFGNRRAAEAAFRAAGVVRRHAVINPLAEDVSSWSTAKRIDRYLIEAMPLGKGAVAGALEAAGLPPNEVGLFVMVSCTGYATPGIDIQLARDLEMHDGLQRLLIGHVGCHAAIPGLGAASDYVIARGKPALLLCLELCSLHIQPPSSDLEQVVVHALFSDGASAFVLEPMESDAPVERAARGTDLYVADIVASTDLNTAEMMTWSVTDVGFRMTLSRQVPSVLATQVGPLIDGLLDRNGLSRQEIDGWAVHPGGPRILDVIGDVLSLDPKALDSSRAVLAEHGNCSSVTVLLAIEAEANKLGDVPDAKIVVLAFGPGLTTYAMLLRRS